MEQLFVSIGEAARVTGQSDLAVMRAIKEYLAQPNAKAGELLKKEVSAQGFIYLVNRELLRRVLSGEEPQESVPWQEEREASRGQDLFEAKEEMIAMLKTAIETKDRQIEDLSKKIDQLLERGRETNILLKTLQDKLFLLEQGGPSSKKQP